MNRSHVEPKRPNDKVTQDLAAAKESLAAKPKDDNDLVNATSGDLHQFETKFVQFQNNNYWRQPDLYDLEELMKDEQFQ